MCQIITLKTTKKKFRKIRKDSGILDSLEDLLRVKGGDYYSGALIANDQKFIITCDSFDDTVLEISSFLKHQVKEKDTGIQVLFFSRQQPEMEISNVQGQPYRRSTNGTFIFAVHGTIHNDKELAEEYNVELGADTEILQYMPIDDWHKAQGAFAVIGIDECGLPMVYEHGLKIWSNKITCCTDHLADIISTGDLTFLNPLVIDLADTVGERVSRTLMASFSGGMDIGLSTYKALATGEYHTLVMNYFAWGSKAEEVEIKQLEKFKDFYSSEFPDVHISIRIREVEYYFDEYFKVNQAPIPKISINNKDSEGDVLETESPLAYVPYRNTQFAILLASICEAEEVRNVDFIFGLNLSEGMVFMDNSEGWLESISNTVKFGGKDPQVTKTYNVIAPYFPRTKTNMLKEFRDDFSGIILEQLLELSTSCYYPGDSGVACGDCGSCVLRKKAEMKSRKIMKLAKAK